MQRYPKAAEGGAQGLDVVRGRVHDGVSPLLLCSALGPLMATICIQINIDTLVITPLQPHSGQYIPAGAPRGSSSMTALLPRDIHLISNSALTTQITSSTGTMRL